jgi:hypothetical protein
VRGRNGAAATAEEAFAALAGGLRETRRPAVIARRARSALADVLEAVAVAVGAIGATELGRIPRPLGAIAAGRAFFRVGGVAKTERSRGANLNAGKPRKSYNTK